MQILAEEATEEDEELIGPPPPELAEELDDAGADERSAEVVRILRCAAARLPAFSGIKAVAKASAEGQAWQRRALP